MSNRKQPRYAPLAPLSPFSFPDDDERFDSDREELMHEQAELRDYNFLDEGEY